MSAIARDYRRLVYTILSILAGLIALAAMKEDVKAEETRTFVIPGDDAYGTDHCMGKDAACAQVIASAWCEAHGLAAPIAYGRAEDMTATIPAARPVKFLDPNAFIVTCK